MNTTALTIPGSRLNVTTKRNHDCANRPQRNISAKLALFLPEGYRDLTKFQVPNTLQNASQVPGGW